MALAAINAFSQLGNIAGSYVWDLSANGYRKSYGIVTAMFGVTIMGCLIFKMMLTRLNRELELGEMVEWDVGEEAANRPGEIDGAPADEAVKMRKGFRYLV